MSSDENYIYLFNFKICITLNKNIYLDQFSYCKQDIKINLISEICIFYFIFYIIKLINRFNYKCTQIINLNL